MRRKFWLLAAVCLLVCLLAGCGSKEQTVTPDFVLTYADNQPADYPTTLAMIVFEALPHVPGLMWLDDMDAATQVRLLPVLIGSILIYVGCMALTFQASARAYEKVDM